MFERILLALDDSPAGEVATVFATSLARKAEASVHVLHVNEHTVCGNGLTLHSSGDATALVMAAVTQMTDAGVRASGSVRVSSYRHVPAVIAATAHERMADAIVLGSNRSHRLGRLFSARVRERVTRATPLPVLTAPSPLKVTGVDGIGAWGDLAGMLDAILSQPEAQQHRKL